jgi:hypothetical protein
MVASSAWNRARGIWNLPLDHPIEAERGHRLATLGDVAEFILVLPDALRQHESWQSAAKTVLEALKSRDTTLVTRAVYMALVLNGERTWLGPGERAQAWDGYRTPWPEPNKKETNPLQNLVSLTRDLAAVRLYLQTVIGSVKDGDSLSDRCPSELQRELRAARSLLTVRRDSGSDFNLHDST